MSEKILKYEFELLRFMFEPKSSIRDLECLFLSYLNLLNNLTLEDQLYIIRLCVSYGSKIKNKKKLFDRLLNNRFDAQYFNFVDLLISEGLITNEDVIDFYFPKNYDFNYYSFALTKLLKSGPEELFNFLVKYKIVSHSLDGKPKKYGKIVFNVLKYIFKLSFKATYEHFHNMGYHFKHTHFKSVRHECDVAFVIKNYHVNKYKRWVKYFVLSIQDDFGSFNSKKDDYDWRWFFHYFSQDIERYKRAGPHVIKLRDKIKEYSKNHVKEVVNILTERLTEIPTDVVKYCLSQYLC